MERRGLIALGSDDEAGLRAAIADAGYTATAIEMVVVELENRPGTGAEVTRKLADAGIDLQIAVPVGMSGDRVQMAFGAHDAALLKRTLGVSPDGGHLGCRRRAVQGFGPRRSSVSIGRRTQPAANSTRSRGSCSRREA